MSSQLPEPDLDEIIAESRGRAMRFTRLYTFPYWFFFLVLLGVLLAISILTDSVYANIFNQLIEGLIMTLFVSATSYATALLCGGSRRHYPLEPARPAAIPADA